jgi:hypothetical protein
MARISGCDQEETTNSIDAYLDAFISGSSDNQLIAEADLAEEEPIEPKQEPPVLEQKVMHQPGGRIESFKNFSSDVGEIQRLRQLLREPQLAPIPVRNRKEKPRPKIAKKVLFLCIATVTAMISYQYYRGCTDSNTCLWSSKRVKPQQLSQASQLAQAKKLSNSEINPFREAVRKAMNAATLGTVAETEDEWNAVADEWLTAIHLMKAVPTSSPKYELAQEKVKEYMGYLLSANQEARKSAEQKMNSSSGQIKHAFCEPQ